MTDTAPSDGAGPPSEGGALRERILHVATRSFSARGYAATSMRDLAEAAGCTKPALYYYFGSKEALFAQLIEHHTALITTLIQATLDEPGSLRLRMQSGMRAYFTLLEREPHALGLLLRAELRAEPGMPAYDFRSLRQTHDAQLRRMLEEGVAMGEIRPDVDLDHAVLALAAVIEQKCWRLVLHGEPVPASFPERIIDLFFHGVAP